MPRLPRIHIEKGLYFVATISDHGKELFRDEGDFQEYMNILTRYREEYAFKLFAYVLTAKLVYLLIELGGEGTVSDVMHAVNTVYTKYYNARYERKGHLFQGRFKSAVIEKGKYLAEFTRLVNYYPVIAKLAKEPGDYRWSSYNAYTIGEGDAKEVLDTFSAESAEQKRLYGEFMKAAVKSKEEVLLRRALASRAVGSVEFVKEIERAGSPVGQFASSVGRRTWDVGRGTGETVERGTWDVGRGALIALGTGLIAILVVIGLQSYFSTRRVVNKVENMIEQREAEIKKDLQDKYRTDLVAYYRAMSKRLELEKNRSEKEKTLAE